MYTILLCLIVWYRLSPIYLSIPKYPYQMVKPPEDAVSTQKEICQF